jgi:hypothetical protein
LAVGVQGGGEAVGVGELVAGVEFGGLFGEVVGGGDQVDRELSDFPSIPAQPQGYSNSFIPLPL